MDKVSKIKEQLRQNVGVNLNLPIQAEVVSVEGKTCTVKLITGLQLTNVKLLVTDNDANDHVLILPKVGSKVLMISLTGDLSNLTVIKFNEIDKVSIKNEEVSLLDQLLEFSGIIKQLKVYTPQGVSGNPIPDTIAKLTQFETNIKKLLK